MLGKKKGRMIKRWKRTEEGGEGREEEEKNSKEKKVIRKGEDER
jgi:hypothetical protein